MSDVEARWACGAAAIIISSVAITGAVVETTKTKQVNECKAAYATSTRTVAEIKELCK